MQACFQELLPASGVDFATTLNLTPSTIKDPSSASSRVITNFVTARNNWLRIYEVREEDISFSTPTTQEHRIQNGSSRRGTEAVAGEIEMDSKGEGFVSVDTVKVCMLTINILSYTCNLCELRLIYCTVCTKESVSNANNYETQIYTRT